jgi:ferrous iron transport protein A
MKLGELQVGDSGRVAGFEESGRSYRRKLLAMGLTPGTAFNVTRVAPMGDPVELEVRGFRLSLRRDEAAAVRVEKS